MQRYCGHVGNAEALSITRPTQPWRRRSPLRQTAIGIRSASKPGAGVDHCTKATYTQSDAARGFAAIGVALEIDVLVVLERPPEPLR